MTEKNRFKIKEIPVNFDNSSFSINLLSNFLCTKWKYPVYLLPFMICVLYNEIARTIKRKERVIGVKFCRASFTKTLVLIIVKLNGFISYLSCLVHTRLI